MQGVIAFIGLMMLAALVTLLVLPASFLYAIPILLLLALLVWGAATGLRPAAERMEASDFDDDEAARNTPTGVRPPSQ